MKRTHKIIYIIFMLLIIISISQISYAANLTSNEYKITAKENTNYIIGIYPNTRAEKVKNNLKAETNINIYDKNGQMLKDDAIVATGSKIQIGQETYIAIVCGDANADGNASLTDLVKIKSHLIGKEILTGAAGIATDVDASGKTTSTDILNLKRLLVRIIEEREIFEGKYSNNEYNYKKNKLTDKITITELKDSTASGTLQIPSKIDGNEVKEINGFLGENSKITKVTIPTGIEKISNTAFSGLTKLQEIEVSGLNEKYSSEDGILYNKEKDTLVFYPRGKANTEYTIKAEVKKLGQYAFYKNSTIQKLYIPDTVQDFEKNAFEEMQGKVYVKEGAQLIAKLKEKGISYAIDAKPEVTKLTSVEGTNQVITLNIEGTDDEGIVAWGVALKGSQNIQWKEISQTKKLSTTYKEINQNGTYIVSLKDTVGNIGTKEIIISGMDNSIPTMKSIKIISPTSGEYKPGQKVVIRVQFSEKVKGTAPTLKLKIGDTIGTGTMNATEPTGTLDYIDYTYTANDKERGKVEIYSYTGGSITDVAGNKAAIVKLANTGNTITMKGIYNSKYPPYKYATTGGTIKTYKDASIEISIEKISGMYVSKIWIAEPSKQIKKVDNYAQIGDTLSRIPNAIIGCNGGYFEGESKHVGRVIITEGRVVSTSDDKNTEIMGITANGKLVYDSIRKKSAQEMLNMGIVNTFGAYPAALIENGKYNSAWANVDSRRTHRTAIGQINDNNYVIITNGDSTLTYVDVANMGKRLNCQFLFNIDGGGSTQLWVKNQYIKRSYESRKVLDALYFITLE